MANEIIRGFEIFDNNCDGDTHFKTNVVQLFTILGAKDCGQSIGPEGQGMLVQLKSVLQSNQQLEFLYPFIEYNSFLEHDSYIHNDRDTLLGVLDRLSSEQSTNRLYTDVSLTNLLDQVLNTEDCSMLQPRAQLLAQLLDSTFDCCLLSISIPNQPNHMHYKDEYIYGYCYNYKHHTATYNEDTMKITVLEAIHELSGEGHHNHPIIIYNPSYQEVAIASIRFDFDLIGIRIKQCLDDDNYYFLSCCNNFTALGNINNWGLFVETLVMITDPAILMNYIKAKSKNKPTSEVTKQVVLLQPDNYRGRMELLMPEVIWKFNRLDHDQYVLSTNPCPTNLINYIDRLCDPHQYHCMTDPTLIKLLSNVMMYYLARSLYKPLQGTTTPRDLLNRPQCYQVKLVTIDALSLATKRYHAIIPDLFRIHL